jgi:nucleotide-binding universal stress UspA family protein
MKNNLQVEIRKIMVPVDFSEPSRSALHYAVALAKPFKAEILLLHVVEPVMPPPPDFMAIPPTTIELTLRLQEEAVRVLHQWRNEAAGAAAVKEIVRTGSPYHEIVEAADEHNADLIAMGTHGRTGLAHLLLGSTAERVTHHAHCPVLVVRERKQASAPASKQKTSSLKSEAKTNKQRPASPVPAGSMA